VNRFRLATRLYPRDWRARYGTELQELLEDLKQAGEPRWRLTAGVLWAATRERVGNVRRSGLARIGGTAVLAAAALLAVVSLAGSEGQSTVAQAHAGRVEARAVSEIGSIFAGGILLRTTFSPGARIPPCPAVAFSTPAPPEASLSGPIDLRWTVGTGKPRSDRNVTQICSYRVSYGSGPQMASSVVYTVSRVLVGPN
jgi:hypothetical protein